MGYTHYYYTKPTISQTNWNKLMGGVIPLFMGNTKIQYDYDNSKPPVVNENEIRFNGIGEDGHETFLLLRKDKPTENIGIDKSDPCTVFSFCKTASKPYDAYVTAVLILAKLYLKDEIKIASDGDISDWKLGLELIRDRLDLHIEMLKDPEAKNDKGIGTAIIREKIKETV